MREEDQEACLVIALVSSAPAESFFDSFPLDLILHMAAHFLKELYILI